MKLKLYNIFLICIFLPGSIFAQNKMNVKYAQDVFNRLVKTINQSTPSKPQLVISPSNDLIAVTNKNGEVMVGYSLIDHCRSFGKDSSNALAHILSHELTHYYSNHFWAENFGSAYADLNWGQLIANAGKTYSVIKLYETQADEYGMYYAFAAGYKTLLIGDRVLDSVYAWYRLDQQLPGYPSLYERKSIALSAKENIAHLLPAFETGNYLMEIAQIVSGTQQSQLAQMAGYYYDEVIAHKIQTKELYNNSGLAKLTGLMPYFDDSISSIRFPFMLETKSLLYNNAGSRGDQSESDSVMQEIIHAGLEEAEELFLNAIRADRNFFPAHINLAILYILMGKYGAADDELGVAARLQSENHYAATELSAILAACRKNNDAALSYFDNAKEAGSLTAAYNQQLFFGGGDATGRQTENSYYSTDTTEQFGQRNVFEFLDMLAPNKSYRIDLISEKAALYIDTASDYTVYYIRATIKPSPGKIRFMVLKENAKTTTSKGLRRGDTIVDLQKKYGKPATVILEADAAIWSYPGQNLLVWVENDQIMKWAYWWVK